MEEIFAILGVEAPFDKNGALTEEGSKAYEKLVEIIENLHRIGVIRETVDDCEKCFDEIIRLGY